MCFDDGFALCITQFSAKQFLGDVDARSVIHIVVLQKFFECDNVFGGGVKIRGAVFACGGGVNACGATA
jgi:hypothetical protein